MTAIAFDTLSASKRLREAGMDERAAEAIVELVQQTARMPEISNLATKAEVGNLATKAELQATSAELQATNAELRATKIELKGEFRSEMASLETRLSEKMRVQGWALMGGVAVLITISTALIKLVP
jgi:parvulin-like peptidyl-prolyl isomerase